LPGKVIDFAERAQALSLDPWMVSWSFGGLNVEVPSE
jgi:hypothetical protein